ncbi:hypothetical protein DFH08DRAFT_870469, partial [Mycena albidolilacea]
MQSFFLLLAAALGTSAAVAPHAPLEINTPPAPLNPSAAQCEPLLITWSGGIRASPCSLARRIPYAYARLLPEIPHVNHDRSSAFKPTPSSRCPSLALGRCRLPKLASPG